jgi:hypothetical protein
MDATTLPVSPPRRQGLLDLLAWAIADGRRPREWWAEQLCLDAAGFDALLEGEDERLLRARMLNAVAGCTTGQDVARALRGRVLELLAGAPKAAVLAAAALTMSRLPQWAVQECRRRPKSWRTSRRRWPRRMRW